MNEELLKLASIHANAYLRAHPQYRHLADDIKQAARIGAWDASKHPLAHTALFTYTKWGVRAAIDRTVMTPLGLRRKYRFRSAYLNFNDDGEEIDPLVNIASEAQPEHSPEFARQQFVGMVNEAEGNTTQKKIVSVLVDAGVSLTDIGAMVGVCKQRISQIARAL